VVGSHAARADDDGPARAYARRSTTVFVATELSPLPTVATRVELGAGLRLHRRGGLAVEVRLGGAFSASGVAGGYLFGARAGVSAGHALAVTRRIVVTPMIAGDVFAYRQSGDASNLVIPRLTVELPVSVVIYPHVVIEPTVQLGVQWLDGSRDVAVVVAPRIGVVL